MSLNRKKPSTFFRMLAGSEPVRGRELPKEECQAIGKDLAGAMAVAGWGCVCGARLETAYGRYARTLRRKGRRVLLCLYGEHLVSWHGFIKKRVLRRMRIGNGAKAPEGVGARSKKQIGSSFDDFLKGEGIFEEVQAQAVQEVVAWQLAEAMKKKKSPRTELATLLSRTQVDRLLNAKDDITLSSLQRAAAMAGRRVIELV